LAGFKFPKYGKSISPFLLGGYNGHEAGGFTSAAGAATNSTAGAGPEGEV